MLFNFTAPCPAGSYSFNGLAPCTSCPYASYQASVQQLTCVSCNVGFNTTTTGSTAAGQCLAICPIGASSSTGLSPCTLCSIGSYQSSNQSTSCTSCPQGTTTLSTGSNTSENCRGLIVFLWCHLRFSSLYRWLQFFDGIESLCRMCHRQLSEYHTENVLLLLSVWNDHVAECFDCIPELLWF